MALLPLGIIKTQTYQPHTKFKQNAVEVTQTSFLPFPGCRGNIFFTCLLTDMEKKHNSQITHSKDKMIMCQEKA